jgi:flagellar basal body-associated protein FliL
MQHSNEQQKDKSMTKSKKIFVIVLVILNLVVLLGQIWPEGAPPFARTVNIVFLLLSVLFFASLLIKRKDN